MYELRKPWLPTHYDCEICHAGKIFSRFVRRLLIEIIYRGSYFSTEQHYLYQYIAKFICAMFLKVDNLRHSVKTCSHRCFEFCKVVISEL